MKHIRKIFGRREPNFNKINLATILFSDNATDGNILMLKNSWISKISKMKKKKNWKYFRSYSELPQENYLEPNDQIKDFCHWNENFLMEIYRNIYTFALQVPWECGFWTTRNGAVHQEQCQRFIWHQTETVCWKTCKGNKVFGCVVGTIFYNIEWDKVGKISDVLWVKLYCKMSDLCC